MQGKRLKAFKNTSEQSLENKRNTRHQVTINYFDTSK